MTSSEVTRVPNGPRTRALQGGGAATRAGDAERASARMAFCLHLGKPERACLESLAQSRRLRPGETLCSVGEPADHVFIIVSGVLKLYKALADGRRQISRFLFSADYFGPSEEVARYPWTAQTITVAEAWCLERRPFADLLQASPELAQGLLGVAWDELESAREHMLLLAHKGAEEKIASFLLWLARRQRERDDGEPLSLPMTRRDIADYLGLKTETVSRTLRGLHRRGVILLPDPGHAALMHREVLESLASGRRRKKAA